MTNEKSRGRLVKWQLSGAQALYIHNLLVRELKASDGHMAVVDGTIPAGLPCRYIEQMIEETEYLFDQARDEVSYGSLAEAKKKAERLAKES